MKQKLLYLALFLTVTLGFSQEHAWVYFNSKADVANYLANPTLMLTQRAIDRRNNQGIAIDFTDVPVDPAHITAIQNATGITYKAKSRWFNAVHVIGSQADINALTSLSFVDHVEFADRSLNPSSRVVKHKNDAPYVNKFQSEAAIQTNFNYGNALNQIQMFNGDKLHELGFTGSGMYIAIIDAGFPSVDTNPAFQRLRDNNQILGGYDFVADSANVYGGYLHGTEVLSDIGGYIDGQFVGTAPDASFYLFRSEDAVPETPVEESYWVEAAEEADRLGVDIINSSLGYATFDEAKYNYDYTTDLDGQTSFISRGAAMAFTKGMIVVNSAGNSGNNASWGGRIAVPADVETVLSVGAVTASGTYASFSSRGPTSDNRLKPDVVAQGSQAYVVNPAGAVVTSNGTSFASPILAGGIACLWQALPNLTNAEIVQFVKESASIFNNPNYNLGYGIPDLDLARQNALSVQKNNINEIGIYPNPVHSNLTINLPEGVQKASLTVYTILGKKILAIDELASHDKVDLSALASGVYLTKITTVVGTKTIKLIKD